MKPPGADEALMASRGALLDALEALAPHREALVLIGAQAIYLWTGGAAVALAETTDDSDLAVDRRLLADDPLLEDAMSNAGFHRNVRDPQPGAWISPAGVPVDLMLPEAMATEPSRRSANPTSLQGRGAPRSRARSRRRRQRAADDPVA